MRKILRYILMSVVSVLAFAGCDVHFFPKDEGDLVPFMLHLDFSTEMPLYKVVVYTRGDEDATRNPQPDHDVRYIVNAYRTDNVAGESRIPDTTFVFTKPDVETLDYSALIEIPEGEYTFRVWCDYVDEGSKADKYYNTSDFSEIILADRKNHSGSNDYRDAFRGTVSATVINPLLYTGAAQEAIDNQARVEMKRPMGKYKFVSTDVEGFIVNLAKKMQERGQISPDVDTKLGYEHVQEAFNIHEYYVKFRYSAFMPCSYNIFTDKPADSWTNMTYLSNMYIENGDQMAMGFDYIFVNGVETTLSISLEVYDKEGELVSSTNPIQVPVVRSKLTLVTGEFLTSMANGGVAIDPSYDGDDYNVEIF